MKTAGIALLFLVFGLVSCDNSIKKERWDNGTVKSELRHEDGQLNGTCKWYYQNGKPQMQADYVDNKLHGRMLRWFDTGTLSEDGWYYDGERDSVWRSYSTNGMLVSETHYSKGKLSGEIKKWYENGQLFMEGQYAEGMMNGSWMIFYDNGNLSSTANYVMGKGTQTGYDETGFKCLTVSYDNNLKHGKEVRFGPDGKKTATLFYYHGQQVDSLKFAEKAAKNKQ